MCTICKIKNVALVEEIERRLNTNAGSLTDRDKKELVQNFASEPTEEELITKLTPNECSLHWNFHQAVAIAPPEMPVEDDTTRTSDTDVGEQTNVRKPMGSLAADVGKSEAAVLYGLLGKQMATFNALTNRMNETLAALGDNDEDKAQALSIPVIHPSVATFYNELAGSIRATTKEIRELNAAVNGQANPAMEGLKALAIAIHGAPSNSTPAGEINEGTDDLTTDKYDY